MARVFAAHIMPISKAGSTSLSVRDRHVAGAPAKNPHCVAGAYSEQIFTDLFDMTRLGSCLALCPDWAQHPGCESGVASVRPNVSSQYP